MYTEAVTHRKEVKIFIAVCLVKTEDLCESDQGKYRVLLGLKNELLRAGVSPGSEVNAGLMLAFSRRLETGKGVL